MRGMKRKGLVAACFWALLSLGCVNHDKPTVQVSSWGDVKENAILATIIADFQKLHPEIKVDLLRVPYGEYMSKLFTQFVGGIAPDVIFVGSDDVVNMSERGILEPLDEYVKATPEFPIQDIYPYAIKTYTVGGRLYAIGRDVDPECDVYYNKKAFDEAHLPYPKDDWTWKELLADAKALVKRDAKGNVLRWGFVDDWAMTEPWIYSSGARWVDDSFNPTRYVFNDPKFVRALQFRADLILKHKVMPTPSGLKAMGGVGSSDMFASGASAMFLSGIYYSPKFRDIKDFQWDITLFPRGPEGQRGFDMAGSGYGIMRTSKHKKEAWMLVTYMAGVEGQRRMASSGLVFPALMSVGKSEYFLDGKPPLNKKVLLGVVPYGVMRNKAMNWREISDGIVGPVFDRIWEGTLTAQEAVSQLNEKLKAMPPIARP